MDDIFLYDENVNENTQDENYINENEIIYRDNNINCDNNIIGGIYDIEQLIRKDIKRERLTLSNLDLNEKFDTYIQHNGSASCNKLKFNLASNFLGGVTYKEKVIGLRLNNFIFSSSGTSASNTILRSTFIDIVIEEIPYNVCCQNPRGLNIIERASTHTYTMNTSILNYQKQYDEEIIIFQPIAIHSLTISIYYDNRPYIFDKDDIISFDFELLLLNK